MTEIPQDELEEDDLEEGLVVGLDEDGLDDDD